METRKLQEVGGGSFTVSIPKKWVEKNGLDAGTTIHLYRHLDGSIIVRGMPQDGDILPAIQIELTDESPPAVARIVQAANDVGVQGLTLRSGETLGGDSRRSVRSAVRDIAGARIRSEEDNTIRVHFALNPSEVSINQSLDQLRFVALSVHRQATTALITGDGECLDRIDEHEAEARRVRNILRRLCNRSLVSFQEMDELGRTRPAIFDACQTANHLFAISGAGARIARLVERHPQALPDTVAESVRSVADESRQAVTDGLATVMESSDAQDAEGVANTASAVGEEIATLRQRHCYESGGPLDSREAAVHLARALDALAETTNHASAIAEVGLRSSLRSVDS
jgi:phosphate uptake regulator